MRIAKISMGKPIHIKQISTAAEFEGLRINWNTLLENNYNNHVFLTWEFLFNWWKVYGATRQLFLITAWHGKQLIGIAPLMIENRKTFSLRHRVLCNLGVPDIDIGGFILQPENEQAPLEICSYIKKHEKLWDIIDLREFLFKSTEIISLKRIFNKTGFAITESTGEHYFISIQNDWEIYNKQLSRKFRYNLRRALRLAEDIGAVTVKHYSGNQITWECFETIIEINRHAHFPRLSQSPIQQEFIRQLINQKNEKGLLNIYILSIGDRPVAYEYGFIYNGRFDDWRTGYDTDLPANISIGKLLAAQVIEACFKDHLNEIDFLRGTESYKNEWKPNSRTYVNLRIFQTKKINSILYFMWLSKIKPLIKRKEK
jgi:CelD/BcsL family acetyltransferase involved in cellulose biosynthesis